MQEDDDEDLGQGAGGRVMSIAVDPGQVATEFLSKSGASKQTRQSLRTRECTAHMTIPLSRVERRSLSLTPPRPTTRKNKRARSVFVTRFPRNRDD